MSIYGLIIGTAAIICLTYFSKHQQIIPKSQEYFFFFGLLISALVGARIYHVLSSLPYYLNQPGQILNIPAGGLGIFGALTFGFIYLFLYSHIYPPVQQAGHLSFVRLLDLITPILPLGQSIGRFANYFNHEIPIWWLESLLCLLLFLFIQRFPRHPSVKYLIGYGFIRLIT